MVVCLCTFYSIVLHDNKRLSDGKLQNLSRMFVINSNMIGLVLAIMLGFIC